MAVKKNYDWQQSFFAAITFAVGGFSLPEISSIHRKRLYMANTLMVINLVVSALIVLLVLVQFGKGAEAGLMSGGASDAVFSAAQKGNILSRTTAVLVVIFLVNSIVMAKIQGRNTSESLFDKNAPITQTTENKAVNPAQPESSAPAAPAAPESPAPKKK